MRIRTNVVPTEGGLTEKDPKTHQVRQVDLDPGSVDVLRAHRADVEERARWAGTELAADAFVISRDPAGVNPIRPEYLTRGYKRAARAAGVPDSHLHDLRHLFATLQLGAGVPMRIVSKRLGHAKESTTSDIYNHAMPGEGRAAADILGKLLGS